MNSDSKRIASNTILLFIRMLVLMLINLYAVRIILRNLGDIDYGIYNAIAGLVTATSFLSGVMEYSTQRFYSFYMGKGDAHLLKKIFSASLNINVTIALSLLVLFETIGLWFLNTHLNIPPERLEATRLAYHFSVGAFLLTIVQIPYSAAVVANEEMGTYTLISVADCLLKLSAAILIGLSSSDNLVFYAACMSISALIVFFLYALAGHIRYKECRYIRFWDRHLYLKLISFSGWMLYGSLSRIGMIQGNTLLLNVFFGPMANAAYAISIQISNALNTLSSCMITAIRPPMIKAYAEAKTDYLNSLFSASNKFIIYVLSMIGIPLILEMDTILELWLGDVSSTTVIFSRLAVVHVIVLALNNPISIIMLASGKIRQYNLPVETVTICCLPVAWLCLKLGAPESYVYYSMIAVCAVAHIVRIFCLQRYYPAFSAKAYVADFLLPALAVITGAALCCFALHTQLPSKSIRLAAVFLFTPTLIAMAVYRFCISEDEKAGVRNIFMPIINKIRH